MCRFSEHFSPPSVRSLRGISIYNCSPKALICSYLVYTVCPPGAFLFNLRLRVERCERVQDLLRVSIFHGFYTPLKGMVIPPAKGKGDRLRSRDVDGAVAPALSLSLCPVQKNSSCGFERNPALFHDVYTAKTCAF